MSTNHFSGGSKHFNSSPGGCAKELSPTHLFTLHLRHNYAPHEVAGMAEFPRRLGYGDGCLRPRGEDREVPRAFGRREPEAWRGRRLGALDIGYECVFFCFGNPKDVFCFLVMSL